MSEEVDAFVETPVKKKSKFLGFLKFVSVVSIIGGAVYTLLQKFRSDADTGWTSSPSADSYVAYPIADVTEDIARAAEN